MDEKGRMDLSILLSNYLLKHRMMDENDSIIYLVLFGIEGMGERMNDINMDKKA